jgi:uncharacterized membrane protein YdjX (TVP38/TMEM64 family)
MNQTNIKSFFLTLYRSEVVRIICYIILLFSIGYGIVSLFQYFGLGIEDVREFSESIGLFGPIILVLLITASLIFSPLSSGSVIALAVVMYGAVPGYIIGVVAGMLGGGADYYLASRYGKKFILRFVGPKTIKVVEEYGGKIKKRGLPALLIAMPLSLDLVSYGAGLVQFDKKQYAVSLVFGVLLNTLAIVLITTGFISFI